MRKRGGHGLYIRVTLDGDLGKDIACLTFALTQVVASSLALSQACRAARAGAGERLRGMLVQLLREPRKNKPWFSTAFRLHGSRPRARHHSVSDMQRKPLD